MWREIERVLFHCNCVIKLPIETDTRRVLGQQFYFSFTPFSKMRMLNLRCSRHSAMKFWGRYFFTSIYTLYFFMFSKTRSVNPLNSFESFSIPIKSIKAWITEWLSTLWCHSMRCPKGKKTHKIEVLPIECSPIVP